MSQASKQVDWCLRKAQEEIAECKKNGVKEKHRGLLKIKIDNDEAKRHIEKAEHYLESTEYLLKGKFADISVQTVFYSLYQCFLAIAAKFGYESGNQTCTVSLIEFLIEEGKINLDNKFIKYFKYEEKEDTEDSVIEMREEYTYGTKVEAEKSKVNFLIEECKELIDSTRDIVYK